MLNEHVYCPRLFALEWLQGLWADNVYTLDGSRIHKRVDDDSPKQSLEGQTRSVTLSDVGLGLTAKLDLLEEEGGFYSPVDYKRGRVPLGGVWEPERVQLCAQGLLLRANGLPSERGYLWFAESRRRVEVVFDAALIERTLQHRDAALDLAQSPQVLPPPLVDSPKCDKCSLVGICLPHETNHLRGVSGAVRPILPVRQDREALHVQLKGGKLGKSYAEIVVKDREGERARAPIPDTSQVVLHGNVSITTPLLHELMRRDVPVCFHGYGGWFQGMAVSASGTNVFARIAQHKAAQVEGTALARAKEFVCGKILNQRTLLRRNGGPEVKRTLSSLKQFASQVDCAGNLRELLGIEGIAARLYFSDFDKMLREDLGFRMDGRNRRPPTDPVNAMLSFGYACLVRECVVALHRIGLDPYVGFLHQPRHGRPALALDLMEEFRPLIVDSVVLSCVNQGIVGSPDFIMRSVGVSLSRKGKAAFLRTFEQRLDQELTHPVFGTRWSWRRTIAVQGRLLSKVLTGELDRYVSIKVR